MNKITGQEVVFSTPWFNLVAKTVAQGNGDPEVHYAIEASDYVAVVARTRDDHILLVRQFRPAVEQHTIELPGGTVDPGETPDQAAQRELLEETGYKAGSIEPLTQLMPDTGRLSNRLWCFFAENLERVAEPVERGVDLLKCSVAELQRLIDDGELAHSMHLAPVLLAMSRGKLDPSAVHGSDSTSDAATALAQPVAAATRSAGCDVCVIGGAGHVGLPLSLVLAQLGKRVLIHDHNQAVLDTIRSGTMPFIEHDAEPLLASALAQDKLVFASDPLALKEVPVLIVTIGTPVDEFLNPNMRVLDRWLDGVLPHLSDGQLMMLRSTVCPGTTRWLADRLAAQGRAIEVAFCPERIVQGLAVRELRQLPQIVSGTTQAAEDAAAEFWSAVAPEVVRLSPIEAEFAKLFCNAYRYIQFAAANQFYMLTTAAGVDYYSVLEGLKRGYPRMRDLPRAGFTAGPCLLKDTMQLAAVAQNQFGIGHAAMLVNEGLVLFLISQLEKKVDLQSATIGLLGMAFKADTDDIRSSLSYKLKKMIRFRAASVLTTDPHVPLTADPELLPLDVVIQRSDVLILCTPHSAYKLLDTRGKCVVDVWGFLEQGCGPQYLP